MSTPVVERPRTAARTTPARTARAGSPARPRSAPSGRGSGRPRGDVRAASPGRAPFVLTVMVLLGIGLVATLWLSTAAAADSYRLRDARVAARELSERTEHLHREVAALQSPPALAQRAAEIGMVPAKDPARLVVAADGSVRVVGEPAPAVAPPAVAPPTGLDGGLPAVRSVPAPELVPQQVAAAAVAVARPVVERALAEAEEAAQEEAAREEAAQEDANQEDATQEDADARGDGAGGDGARGGTDGNGAGRDRPTSADRSDADRSDADRSDADRSDADRSATTGAQRAGGG